MPRTKTSTPIAPSSPLRPSGRFSRSVNLERDITDPRALDGYVVTPQIREFVSVIADSLRSDSKRRAWRITGDYGSGKSLFALALARAFSPHSPPAPSILGSLGLSSARCPTLFSVLVTGSRSSFGPGLVRAVHAAITSSPARGKLRPVAEQASRLLKKEPTATEVVTLLADLGAKIRATGVAAGVLLVVDELGRFLEYSATNPQQQDIGLYQELAEAAARSGATPLLMVGLLHEGFAAYANHLSSTAQREWEKVSGRFDELVFAHPLEQTVMLAAEAIGGSEGGLPATTRQQARAAMLTAIDQGWFGASAGRKHLADLAPRLFPLHPTVLPVAAAVFSRYGQNERSLFSFLVSQDPNGIQAFASDANTKNQFYRLPQFYEYAKLVFGGKLSQQGYRSHWPVIESTVESFPSSSPHELAVLKSVAMMNLVSCGSAVASPESLELAVAGWSDADRDATLKAVTDLRDKRKVLYSRGVRDGLCLWPNTSVDLDYCHHQACQAVPTVTRTAPFLMDYLGTEPIVARRHYIQTGSLRHFSVSYLDGRLLSAESFAPIGNTDGHIFVVLCESEAEHAATLKLLAGPLKTSFPPNRLVAVSAPVAQLQGLVTELCRWDWVRRNVPELRQDRYARDEADRQHNTAKRLLQDRLSAFVGLGITGVDSSLTWFQGGKPVGKLTGRELLELVSIACDKTFSLAPTLRNELVNRCRLSSPAAAARLRLIDRILEAPEQPMLGLDPERRPPEASIYLSVLKAGNLHRKTRNGCRLCLPAAGDADPLRLRPAFDKIMEMLTEVPDARVPVDHIFRTIQSAPYGVRDGLSPFC